MPLRAFRTDYPQPRVCLLCGGRERIGINEVLCLPCDEFLANLIPGAPASIEGRESPRRMVPKAREVREAAAPGGQRSFTGDGPR